MTWVRVVCVPARRVLVVWVLVGRVLDARVLCACILVARLLVACVLVMLDVLVVLAPPLVLVVWMVPVIDVCHRRSVLVALPHPVFPAVLPRGVCRTNLLYETQPRVEYRGLASQGASEERGVSYLSYCLVPRNYQICFYLISWGLTAHLFVSRRKMSGNSGRCDTLRRTENGPEGDIQLQQRRL